MLYAVIGDQFDGSRGILIFCVYLMYINTCIVDIHKTFAVGYCVYYVYIINSGAKINFPVSALASGRDRDEFHIPPFSLYVVLSANVSNNVF